MDITVTTLPPYEQGQTITITTSGVNRPWIELSAVRDGEVLLLSQHPGPQSDFVLASNGWQSGPAVCTARALEGEVKGNRFRTKEVAEISFDVLG